MSLTLELSPMEEQDLHATADHKGVPVDELAHHIFMSGLRLAKIETRRAVLEAEAAKAYAASGESEEEMEDYINTMVKQVRAEMSVPDAKL